MLPGGLCGTSFPRDRTSSREYGVGNMGVSILRHDGQEKKLLMK